MYVPQGYRYVLAAMNHAVHYIPNFDNISTIAMHKYSNIERKYLVYSYHIKFPSH